MGYTQEDPCDGWSNSQKKQMGSDTQWIVSDWLKQYNYSPKVQLTLSRGAFRIRDPYSWKMGIIYPYENDGRDSITRSKQVWSNTKWCFSYSMGLKAWLNSSCWRLYADPSLGLQPFNDTNSGWSAWISLGSLLAERHFRQKQAFD